MSAVTLAVKIGNGELKALLLGNILKLRLKLIFFFPAAFTINRILTRFNGSRDFLLCNY